MLTVADVLDPGGPILPEWFPTEGDGSEDSALHTRLQLYLSEAYARPELVYAGEHEDQAVTRWVEYRVYSRLRAGSLAAAGLKSATLTDQGSFTYGESDAQAKGYASSAAHALAAWRLLTSPPEPIRTADGRYLSYSRDWPVAEVEEVGE